MLKIHENLFELRQKALEVEPSMAATCLFHSKIINSIRITFIDGGKRGKEGKGRNKIYKNMSAGKGILSDTQLSQCGLSWSQWVVNGFLVVWVSSLCMDLGKHGRSDKTPHLCRTNHTPK